jgi:uncharacterized protein YhdP
VGVKEAEPAVAPDAAAAVGEARLRTRSWRWALGAGVTVLTLLIMMWLVYELAAERLPRHRAALEHLVREQTHLDLRFAELQLRWGWYGPEAVFRDVELGVPMAGTVLVRAPQLIVGLDAWRMLRNGEPQADRITLIAPDIALLPATHPAAAARAADPAETSEPMLTALGRVLSHWRGGRFDIEGGSLSLPSAAGAAQPAVLALRHVTLRRAGAKWNAAAVLQLPERLGTTARLTLQMTGDPADWSGVSGTVSAEGRLLDVAGWHSVAAAAALTAPLPQAGVADVDLQLQLTGGTLTGGSGKVRAQGLEWAPRLAGSAPLTLPRLSAGWQLAPERAGWRLTVDGLALGDGGPPALVVLNLASDMQSVSGNAPLMPLATLAAVARWGVPQLPLRELELAGNARRIEVDWNVRRPPGARLKAHAQLEDLALTLPRAAAQLTGLGGQLTLMDSALNADIEARAAQLTVQRAEPARLTDLAVAARLVATASEGGWQLSAEHLQIGLGAGTVSASGSAGIAPGAAHPQLEARAHLSNVDVALLAALTGPIALRNVGAGDAQLTAGRVAEAEFTVRGPLADDDPWSAGRWSANSEFRGVLELRDATLAAGALWPQLQGLDARLDWHGRDVRVLLDGGSAAPLAGLPPLVALRGTLRFRDAHLRRSTLSGQWLGGPVTLSVAERQDGASGAGLAVAARGVLNAHEALLAVSGRADPAPLSGAAEWSAVLDMPAAADARRARWRVRADSSLVGVASALPEPLAKTQGAALALHVDARGDAERGELHLSVGERMRAIVAIERSGDAWRIERGALRLASSMPTLPTQPVLLVDGAVSRLELPAYLLLWRQAGSDAALPAVQVRLFAGQLSIGPRSYPDASIRADAVQGSGEVAIEAADLAGSAGWGAGGPDGAAQVRLTRLDVVQPTDAALGAELVGALGSEVQLTVERLQWRGRPLGRLTAQLRVRGASLEVRDLDLSGVSERTRASARCQNEACELQFMLDSHDAAATLASFGFRPEVDAARAQLSGEVRWARQPEASLASLNGRLHMQLEDGVVHAAGGPAAPLALLAVPALARGLAVPERTAAFPGLRFASFTADYALHDGQAETANLDFDGEAQILMRGRVGLAARDYDAQVLLLKGEERLPAAVRGLAPVPKLAAVWLSLRQLLEGSGADRSAALRLQGTWDDPVVVPVE